MRGFGLKFFGVVTWRKTISAGAKYLNWRVAVASFIGGLAFSATAVGLLVVETQPYYSRSSYSYAWNSVASVMARPREFFGAANLELTQKQANLKYAFTLDTLKIEQIKMQLLENKSQLDNTEACEKEAGAIRQKARPADSGRFNPDGTWYDSSGLAQQLQALRDQKALLQELREDFQRALAAAEAVRDRRRAAISQIEIVLAHLSRFSLQVSMSEGNTFAAAQRLRIMVAEALTQAGESLAEQNIVLKSGSDSLINYSEARLPATSTTSSRH